MGEEGMRDRVRPWVRSRRRGGRRVVGASVIAAAVLLGGGLGTAFRHEAIGAVSDKPAKSGLPVVAAGWEGVAVDQVCLDVAMGYPGVDAPPVDPVIQMRVAAAKILRALGVGVVGSASPAKREKCDATLTFDLTGEAIRSCYTSVGVLSLSPGCSGTELYGGAAYRGTATLASAGRPPVAIALDSRATNAKLSYPIGDPPDTPDRAPWTEAWDGALLHALTGAFGAPAVVGTVKAWPSYPSTLYRTEEDFLVSVGADVVDQVFRWCNKKVYALQDRCFKALGRLVEDRRLDRPALTTIVDAMIDEVAADEPRAGPLLSAVYLSEGGTDVYTTFSWNADQWRQWATEHGL